MEIDAFTFLAQIGNKVFPQTWGMFASFNQDPLRKRLVDKLKEHGVILQGAPIEENYGDLSTESVEFMIQARKSLYMAPIIDLITLVLESYDSSPNNSPEEFPGADPIVVVITLDRLRDVAAAIDRERVTDSTGFEGPVVDLLFFLITQAIWQVIVDNGCEVSIENAPVTFRVPS